MAERFTLKALSRRRGIVGFAAGLVTAIADEVPPGDRLRRGSQGLEEVTSFPLPFLPADVRISPAQGCVRLSRPPQCLAT